MRKRMLREAIQAAIQALDELYAAIDDDDEYGRDVHEQLYTTLLPAEDAYTDALRWLEQ
jgi:hypothetical protein